MREWRGRGRSLAVLAVDPSSKRSGGALLGDRARIEHDPADRGVFIRSMAAVSAGGLAPATRAAAQALANAFDVVVIETVGVGQSETDAAEAADTIAVVVEPGSGDAPQFLMAGTMEVPTGSWSPRPTSARPLAATSTTWRRARRPRRRATPGPRGLLAAALRRASRRSPTRSTPTAPPLDLTAHRMRFRRFGALADFVHEHGERGLCALAAAVLLRRWQAEQDPGSTSPSGCAASSE